MTTGKPKRSIAVLVIAGLVIVTSVLLAATGVREHLSEAARQRTRLRADLRTTTDQTALALSLPVWNFDRPQIGKVIEGVMAEHAVAAVVVSAIDASSPTGSRIEARARDAAWRPVALVGDLAHDGLLVDKRDIVANDNVVGTVSVLATPRFVDADLRSRLVWMVVRILVLDLLLVVALYLLLRRIVLRPLRELEQLAREVSDSEPSKRPPTRLYGELERLHGSLDKTFALLESRYAALRESEEKYRLLAEHVVDVIWVVDPKRELTYVSPSVFRLLGYTPAQILGARPPLVTPEFTERARTAIGAAGLTGSHQVVVELEMLHADGHVVSVESSMMPMYDARGTVIGTISCTRDISERKRGERERGELERRVRQSQKLEAIGTLAGGIAHDFNNMLGAIVGYSEMVVEDLPQSSPLRDDMQKILGATDRAAMLVKQILAFSRKSLASPKPMLLEPIVREALALLRATLPATVVLHDRLDVEANVLADPTEIHQIVMNLCTNAWKAIGERRPGTIEIAIERVVLDDQAAARCPGLAAGPYARLSVTDDGAGMSPEVQERIFEPFFTTREEGEGTGLGLATVHGIVTKAGGAIEVTSAIGKGSTFAIHLPLLGATRDSSGQVLEEAQRGTERVLVVDDERDLADTMQRRLERLGYRVRVCHSGDDALAVVKVSPTAFDLVITDLAMRALPGDKLAAELRAIRADLPIVLCTGSREHLGADWAATLGRAAVVDKPVSLAVLTGAMRQLFAS